MTLISSFFFLLAYVVANFSSLSLGLKIRVKSPITRPFYTRGENPLLHRSGPIARRSALLHHDRPYCTEVGPIAPRSLLHHVPYCTRIYDTSSFVYKVCLQIRYRLHFLDSKTLTHCLFPCLFQIKSLKVS